MVQGVEPQGSAPFYFYKSKDMPESRTSAAHYGSLLIGADLSHMVPRGRTIPDHFSASRHRTISYASPGAEDQSRTEQPHKISSSRSRNSKPAEDKGTMPAKTQPQQQQRHSKGPDSITQRQKTKDYFPVSPAGEGGVRVSYGECALFGGIGGEWWGGGVLWVAFAAGWHLECKYSIYTCVPRAM